MTHTLSLHFKSPDLLVDCSQSDFRIFFEKKSKFFSVKITFRYFHSYLAFTFFCPQPGVLLVWLRDLDESLQHHSLVILITILIIFIKNCAPQRFPHFLLERSLICSPIPPRAPMHLILLSNDSIFRALSDGIYRIFRFRTPKTVSVNQYIVSIGQLKQFFFELECRLRRAGAR